MLTPDQIQALGDQAAQMTAAMEEYLIRDIARRVREAGQLTSTAAYQIWRAQRLGLSRRQIEQMLRRELKVSHKRLRELLTQSAEVGYNFDISRLSRAAVPFEENTVLRQVVAAAVELAKKDFTNLTQTLGLVAPDGKAYPLRKAYRKITDFAFQQVITGAADYRTAIRQATQKLADHGLRSIDYQSGVHTSLEAAVRRNIMGGLGLMQEEISRQNHDLLGADGWEISAHAASAPDHEPIQGRQYSDEAYQALNDSLARRIGTLNCGHAAFPILLGVSRPQYTEAELARFREENARGIRYEGRQYTLYEATQKQRELERAIRRQKRRVMAAEETGDEERFKAAKTRLTLLRQRYREFSKAAGLRVQEERVWVAEQREHQPLKEIGTTPKRISPQAIQRIPRVETLVFPDGADVLREKHRELLSAVSKYPLDTEMLRCYDKQWNLLHQFTGAGGGVRGTISKKAVLILHNHPDGNTFSMKDISFFITGARVELFSAVGNNGAVYLLEKAESYDGLNFYRRYSDWKNQLDLSSMTVEEYVRSLEAMLEEAKQDGVHYVRGAPEDA